MKSSLMLGVNLNTGRQENDYYATHPSAIERAIPYLQECGLDKEVWECACGEGHISKVLVENGYNVFSSDLINRGYGEVADFLQTNNAWDGDILTNPPFNLAEQFIDRGMNAIKEGNKLFMFLKVQFLESKKRKQLFEKYPLKHLLVYSERQLCSRNGEFEKYKAATLCYCWFVFEKGYTGKPTIDWI